MNISAKAINFISAVLLAVTPISGQINKVLPYIQVVAASTVAINNSLQIASRLNPQK